MPVERNRKLSWRVPVGFALGTFGLFALIVSLQPQPRPAVVDGERGSPFSSSYILTVSYQTEEGVEAVEEVLSSQPYDVGDTVLIWPETEERSASVANEPLQLTAGSAVVVTGFGLLLGLVVTLSANGFGFVPGTGKAGETNPEEVQESRGFYWRS